MLIITDAKVSSVIDAEAKGKVIYSSPLPLRSVAAKLGEEQNVAPFPQPWVTGQLSYLAVSTASRRSPSSSSSPHCFPSFLASSPLFWLVLLLSCLPSSASSPGPPAAHPQQQPASQKKETKLEQRPLPPSSPGNATNFSPSAGEGVCVCVCGGKGRGRDDCIWCHSGWGFGFKKEKQKPSKIVVLEPALNTVEAALGWEGLGKLRLSGFFLTFHSYDATHVRLP